MPTDRSDTHVAKPFKPFDRRALNARRPESTKNPNNKMVSAGLAKDLQSYTSGQSSVNTKNKNSDANVVDDWSSQLEGSLEGEDDIKQQVIEDFNSDEDSPPAKKGLDLQEVNEADEAA